MATQRLGVIMNGVTGRMGLNQHLIRSIIAIRDQGGVVLCNGDRVMPDPILVGRNADKIERLAKSLNVARWTTDLDQALVDKNDAIFFDAATTQARPGLLTRAIEAGKHVYCEKPIATNLAEAVRVVKLADLKGVKHGTAIAALPGSESRHAARVGLLRPMLSVRAARLLGSRATGRRRSAPTIAPRTAAASSSIWFHWALRARQSTGESKA